MGKLEKEPVEEDNWECKGEKRDDESRIVVAVQFHP